MRSGVKEGDDSAEFVTDFDPDEDKREVVVYLGRYEEPTELTVKDWADGKGADVVYEGKVVVSVTGGQGLDPADIELFNTQSIGA